jgi:porin
LIDLNADFAYTDQSLKLINSSFGIQPTISANTPVSIFPVTALGGIVQYQISKSLDLSAGFFDGMPSIRAPYQPIPDVSLANSEGFFLIGEMRSKHLIKGRNGTIKIAGWIHSADFRDHHRPLQYSENIGGYLIMDQEILRHKQSNTYVWFKTGVAPRECNIVRYFYGGGITQNNLSQPFSLDHISFGIASADLCNHLNDFENLGDFNETVLELTFQKSYGIVSIQPDIQYIINPSGFRDVNNCLFLSLRTAITIQ